MMKSFRFSRTVAVPFVLMMLTLLWLCGSIPPTMAQPEQPSASPSTVKRTPIKSPIVAVPTVPTAPRAVPPTTPVVTPVATPVVRTPNTVPTTPVQTPPTTPIVDPTTPSSPSSPSSPTTAPCGLFGLSLFCPFGGCGLIKRLFGVDGC